MKKRLIGEQKKFAVQYEVSQVYENFIYGKFCYLINNMQIGEYEEGVTISDLLWGIQDIVKDNGNRVHNELFELDVDQLFYRLNSTLFGEGNDKYNEVAESEVWARFNIGLNIDIFRGYKIFMVESNYEARIVLSDKNGVINQYYTDKGVVDTVFAELYNELNEVYERYI